MAPRLSSWKRRWAGDGLARVRGGGRCGAGRGGAGGRGEGGGLTGGRVPPGRAPVTQAERSPQGCERGGFCVGPCSQQPLAGCRVQVAQPGRWPHAAQHPAWSVTLLRCGSEAPLLCGQLTPRVVAHCCCCCCCCSSWCAWGVVAAAAATVVLLTRTSATSFASTTAMFSTARSYS
jgi:hypothetical protein